jgi:hypothetical protein
LGYAVRGKTTADDGGITALIARTFGGAEAQRAAR